MNSVCIARGLIRILDENLLLALVLRIFKDKVDTVGAPWIRSKEFNEMYFSPGHIKIVIRAALIASKKRPCSPGHVKTRIVSHICKRVS